MSRGAEKGELAMTQLRPIGSTFWHEWQQDPNSTNAKRFRILYEVIDYIKAEGMLSEVLRSRTFEYWTENEWKENEPDQREGGEDEYRFQP